MRKRGFTLIELLVVIAIIAILAAILFPVFMAAKEKAKQTECLTNMKQVGSGFMMYVQNNNDRFPPALWGTPRTAGAAGTYVRATRKFPAGWKYISSDGIINDHVLSWMDSIYPYVKNVNVFDCPSAVHWCKVIYGTDGIDPSYGYNAHINGLADIMANGGSNNNIARPRMMSNIRRTSQAIVNMDYSFSVESNLANVYWRVKFLDKDRIYKGRKTDIRVIAPHNEGTVYTFADGHATYYKCYDAAISEGGDSNRMWNVDLP